MAAQGEGSFDPEGRGVMPGWVMISDATRPDVSLALSIGWMVAPGWRRDVHVQGRIGIAMNSFNA